ncbi:LPS-assembly protein [Haloferula luteola]|uniref:LPS-assembly protein n=1 Tax=Haloferula luteola TaxID=595692 RepID=A0A840UV56_9BACT|nr:LPS assembly protein LptD [Haloferula luteola]MBB5350077.1 LPS-assembly protein [Haloferula luteola]
MRFAAALLFPILPLAAQDVLPEMNGAPPSIGPITPVPLPTDSDIMLSEEIQPEMPKSVNLSFEKGWEADTKAKVITALGPISATGDTGMALRSDHAKYLWEEKKLEVTGAVKLRTETGVEVFADRGVLDDTQQLLTLTGDVSIYQGQTVQRGKEVVYNIQTGKLDFSGLRTGVDPLLLEADGFVREITPNGGQVFVGQHAGVTTDDSENPGFWVRADETRVYPDDRVTFKNMKIYAGDTPIFWLPYFAQPLDADLGYHFVPGGRSNWGAYLLNSYGVMLGEEDDPWLLSRWKLDLRSRRGAALGLDLVDRNQERTNKNLEGLSLYYANDLDPTISRTGLSRGIVNEDRWEASLKYRVPMGLEGGDKWRTDYNLHLLSDKYYIEDFDPQLFRTDPAPDNTIGLFRQDDESLFGVMARFQPNDFYRSDTRLPEITFDQSRRPIFGTSVLHEGNTSFSIIEERIGSTAQINARTLLGLPATSPQAEAIYNNLPIYERQLVQTIRSLPAGSPAIPALTSQLLNPGYSRFHTYQELSLPTKLGGWLNFTPEVGVGYTRYDSIEGPLDSLDRPLFYAGAESSVKFSKDYAAVADRFWGLDGLLHVVQPYARFSFLSTDDPDPLFPGIDRETFSTRPRTLAPDRFTALDSFRNWSIIRLGMRNHLITRRNNQNFEWLWIDTYIDGYFDDPEGLDRRFSNLYNDVTWNPLPWLNFRLETQFPVVDDGSGYSEVAARVNFMPTENFEFSIGNRILNNHPIVTDSNRIDAKAFLRLNDKWGLGATQIWELDDGTLELQQYTIHRDFNYWIGSVGITTRDNRLDTEFGIIFAFTLKDFPSASVPFSLDAQ